MRYESVWVRVLGWGVSVCFGVALVSGGRGMIEVGQVWLFCQNEGSLVAALLKRSLLPVGSCKKPRPGVG